MRDSNIKVSVMMVTYNHEKYIEQAIQSVLTQNIDFNYELLIGEDCSTDHTREIVDRYQEMYPEIIRVIRHNKNIGALKNEAELRQICKGQYIAVLEGDDYWINPNKLKSQVEFLDCHLEYIGVSHNVKVVGENGEKLPYELEGFHHKKEHVYTQKNALNLEMIGHLSGWMYRNIWKNLSGRERFLIKKCAVNSDLKLSIVLGLKGDIYYFEDEWSVYRRRFEGDGWSAQYFKKNMELYYYETDMELEKFLKECYGKTIQIEDRLLQYVYKSFMKWIQNPTYDNRQLFLKLIRKKELKKRVILRYFLSKRFENGKEGGK